MRVDYHIHSSFSLDSETPAREIVEAAIEKQLCEICLTEHKDIDPYYKWTDYYRDEPFQREVKNLQRQFGKSIKIKKGVEMDFQAEMVEEFENFLQRFDFDFVISSVHALEHEFIGSDFFESRDPDKSHRDYLEEVLSLSRLKSFDVIGHLDYIKRHSWKFLNFEPLRYEKIFREIFSNLIKNKKGLEINTSGFKHVHGQPYPSFELVKIFREMGGEIVTIGSDAHRAQDVGKDIEKGVEVLKKAGFDGFYVFEKRKPLKILFR